MRASPRAAIARSRARSSGPIPRGLPTGNEPDVAANGREAIDAVERQRYDLVLMDVQMPEMDGLEATRHIVERVEVARRPWIVAMTANAMDGDREQCIAAGMQGYISKPIRVDELVRALLAVPTVKA
jgi:CheY-like chemotaxis protein